ncbi:MAG: hypothetical protein K0S44_1166 [Bacteroidetes bacterium]|jgi:hypothetical protein|nr:hypothetical protein [Bacteroidota bacterium]
MKKLIKLYCIPLLLTSILSLSTNAQTTSGNNYGRAGAEIKSEKKREKERRKRETKAEKKSNQMETDAQHGWLFKKKKRKKIPAKSESVR